MTLQTANAPAPLPVGAFNPADLSPLPPVPPSADAAVTAAVDAARKAQPAWGALPLESRELAVLELGRLLLTERAEGMRILSQETGRSPTECLMSELVSSLEFARAAVRTGRKALAPEKIPLSVLDYPGKRAVIEAVPRGVVGIIAPWNYPVGNFMKSLLPALLGGNGVVLKPSEHTPRSGAWLHSLCARAFPAGLVQLVQGDGRVGGTLVDRVDAVVFTGSVPTGKRVAVQAAGRLIPCSVELGGKDAAIVLEDADLTRTVAGVAQWAFHNAGQNCAGIERVYVVDAIADAFVDALARLADRLTVSTGGAAGAPSALSDLGPLQNPAQLHIVETHVQQAVKDGAVVRAGGKRVGSGLGYRPTVLDRCTQTMRVVTEETFGPVVAVVRVKDEEEALKLANDSVYGLNGSVWTRNLQRGEALARRMEVGVALVNNHSVVGIMPELPWTGVKDTGPGVASSRHSYPTFVRRRALLVDSAKNPDPWWMPINEDLGAFGEAVVARSLGSLGALLKLGGLLGKRVKAIRKLAEP